MCTNSIRWKNGAHCAVLLTFDFDGVTMWESRVQQGFNDFDTPPIKSMGEYGSKSGMPRILNLLDEYDIPAGFFVPGKIIERYPELIRRIDARGHELGAHGHTHVNLVSMSDENEREEFRNLRVAFKDVIDKQPVGFRSPAEDLSNRTFKHLSNIGIEYDSSLMGSDVPYFIEVEEQTILEIPWFWSQDDATHFNFNMNPTVSYQSGISSPADVLSIWKTEFDACYDEGLLFHLVLHPQIIGRPHRMMMLEKLIQYIRGHSKVWFARPKDVARYWRKNIPEQDRDIRSI